MPRYFIDTFDGIAALDDEGVVLPDLDAAKLAVRRALADMIRDEPPGKDAIQLRADVRDESSRRIMTATLLMVVEEAS